MSHLFKRFSRDITGLIWLSIGIFLALALYSYHPSDPSLNSIGKSLSVKNYCGYFGSFLSDIVYQLLGLGAWIFVLGAIRLAFKHFLNQESSKGRSRWVWTMLLLLTGSSLLSLYWPTKKIFQGQIYLGGVLGNFITKSLIAVFNPAGVGVILWTLAAALIIFYTEKSISEILAAPVKMVKWIFGWIRSRKLALRASSRVQKAIENVKALLEPSKSLVPVTVAARATSKEESSVKDPLFKLGRRFLPIKDEDETDADDEDEVIEDEDAESANAEAAQSLGSGSDVKKALTPKRRSVQLKKAVQRKIENWELPKISLLEDPPFGRKKVDEKEIRQKAEILVNKLRQFQVEGAVVAAKPGPAVTMFEFKPNADVKISKITELADDLSLALSAESVRIIAPIPGRDVVGIETSNSVRETVYLKDILASEEFWDEKTYLPIAMGCDASGAQKIVDLRRMPHMMVAGTTGSGKSVFIVSLLTGLLFRHSPKTLRLILIDPKQVDLAAFQKVPHLLMPPIREPKKAMGALRWAIKEMDKRYRSMSRFGARDLESFNAAASKLSADELAEHETRNNELGPKAAFESYYYTPQPYIVVVCEEFGDLMAVDKQNVEHAVVRLCQMARACGIHMILAMQSPRKDVVTGLIKTNIPARASFKVASQMDSRIILDERGAERLLTRGDMLFVSPGTSKPIRHHGPWVTDPEINRVTTFWSDQAEPEFDPIAMQALEGSSGMSSEGGEQLGFEDGLDPNDEMDEMYDQIVAYVSTLKEVSASLLQRRFRLGYPRAARIVEILEQQGVVGPANGSKPRAVLVNELK